MQLNHPLTFYLYLSINEGKQLQCLTSELILAIMKSPLSQLLCAVAIVLVAQWTGSFAGTISKMDKKLKVSLVSI